MRQRVLDLICMGRAAVDFYSEQIGSSLEEASTFSKYVGGCPANISIGTSRLGLKSAILSRVGDEAMGRFLRHSFEKEGVDVSHLMIDPERLTGLVILGISPPDEFPLIFYRENCADMAIQREDYSDEFLASSQALLVTGTHCSKDEIFEVTKDAVKRAVHVDTKVILDIDYRPVLWGKTGHGGGEERYCQDACFSARISEIIPFCDLVVGTEEEILAATNCQDVDRAISHLSRLTTGVIVRKCGEDGCVVYDRHSAEPIAGRPFPVKVLNVLGAGDAFMSGFLRGYLKGHSLKDCCTFANANGALVVTRHGCSPAMPYWEELAAFINDPKDLKRVERMHFKMEHMREAKKLFLFAFDHRTYFEKLAENFRRGSEAICSFKSLIFDAFKRLSEEEKGVELGVIVDGKYGERILFEAHRRKLKTFRSMEHPNSFPLEFVDGHEASYILRDWPRDQVIKVLCYVSEEEKNEEQIRKLFDLVQALKQTGHQLLIELVDKENCSLERIVQMIEQCYAREIHPNWWKLQPLDDEASWHRIEALVDKHDPYLHGILLLGENRPIIQLTELMHSLINRHEKIKGFAVGRSIWSETAEKWFMGKLADEEAVDDIYRSMKKLMQLRGNSSERNTRMRNDESEPKNTAADHVASPCTVSGLAAG